MLLPVSVGLGLWWRPQEWLAQSEAPMISCLTQLLLRRPESGCGGFQPASQRWENPIRTEFVCSSLDLAESRNAWVWAGRNGPVHESAAATAESICGCSVQRCWVLLLLLSYSWVFLFLLSYSLSGLEENAEPCGQQLLMISSFREAARCAEVFWLWRQTDQLCHLPTAWCGTHFISQRPSFHAFEIRIIIFTSERC